MQSHERILFNPAPPVAAPPPPTPDSLLSEWGPDSQQEQAADRWAPSLPTDTHVGMLPTVPMELSGGDDAQTPPRWLDALTVGTRCKIFLQGQWATAKLSWRSDNGQFFMFNSNLPGGSHSLTKRALLRLRSEGLATEIRSTSPLRALLQRVEM